MDAGLPTSAVAPASNLDTQTVRVALSARRTRKGTGR